MLIRRGWLRYGTAGAWRAPSPAVAEWIGRVFDGDRQPEVAVMFAALKGK